MKMLKKIVLLILVSLFFTGLCLIYLYFTEFRFSKNRIPDSVRPIVGDAHTIVEETIVWEPNNRHYESFLFFYMAKLKGEEESFCSENLIDKSEVVFESNFDIPDWWPKNFDDSTRTGATEDRKAMAAKLDGFLYYQRFGFSKLP